MDIRCGMSDRPKFDELDVPDKIQRVREAIKSVADSSRRGGWPMVSLLDRIEETLVDIEYQARGMKDTKPMTLEDL